MAVAVKASAKDTGLDADVPRTLFETALDDRLRHLLAESLLARDLRERSISSATRATTVVSHPWRFSTLLVSERLSLIRVS
jgi:hypothetical protein